MGLWTKAILCAAVTISGGGGHSFRVYNAKNTTAAGENCHTITLDKVAANKISEQSRNKANFYNECTVIQGIRVSCTNSGLARYLRINFFKYILAHFMLILMVVAQVKDASYPGH